MTLRLNTQSLRIERVFGEGSAETVAEGTVRIPERYPAIGRALQVAAKPVVTTVEPTEDRVLIEGVVRLEMTYVSFEDSVRDDEDEDAEAVGERLESVSWEDGLSFAYLLEVIGATEETQVDAYARASSVTYEVRGDDTTVDVDVLLHLGAKLIDAEELELTVGAVGDGIEYDTEQVRVRSKLGEVESSGRISAALPFAGRSLPESILDVRVEPSLVEVSQGSGETVIRGQLDCNTLYIGAEGAGAQFMEWPRGIGFQLQAEAPEFVGQVSWAPKIDVSVIDYYVESSEEGSLLRVDLSLEASAVAYRVDLVPVVTDLSSENGEVASRVLETELYEAVGEGSTRAELQSVLELPDGLPPIDRLLRGEATLAVEDVHVLGDKVAIEGQVSIDLLYVGRGEEAAELHTARWPYAITVDLEVPIPGAEPGLDRTVSASVRRLEFDLINRETIEARVQVGADARVGRLRTIENVVEAVAIPPDDGERATFTFVVTTPDDTLWKLAQIYRTSVEAILTHNEWIDAEAPLGRGRKICIVK